MLALLVILPFMAAQGAAIFLTAYVALRLLKTNGGGAKAVAMLVSAFAWIAATVTGYFVLGGSGGLMEGAGMLFGVCQTALLSAFIYWLVWISRKPSAATSIS